MAESLQTVLTPTDEKIHEILTKVSEALDVKVELVADGPDGKLMPYFDVNAMHSKIAALMVFVGANVQPLCPPYNRVHADIEYWKKKFESK